MDSAQSLIYDSTPEGLRIVCAHRPQAAVEHFGVAIRAGSSNETELLAGEAHFVEHTIFKGTLRRTAWNIANCMERVGGELNAYTSKEETVVYTTFPSGYLTRALSLVSDLVSNARFPEELIERERGVILEEIDSYLDSPSELVFDEFEDLIFAGSTMAHNILGTKESVERITGADCRRWCDTFFVAERMMVFYSGPVSPSKVIKDVGRYFADVRRGCPASPIDLPPVNPTFDVVKETGTNQAHTVMGRRIGGLMSPDRILMTFIAYILGGPCTNSLLNLDLRERRGLVYAVDASTSLLTDTGLFNIYFGCDKADVSKCRKRVMSVIDRLCDSYLTERRLDVWRRQYLGQLTVASANTESTILSTARAALLSGGEADTRRVVSEKLSAANPDAVRTLASELLSLSTLTLV